MRAVLRADRSGRSRCGLLALVALAAAAFALALPAGASAAKVALFLEKTGTGMGTVTSSPSGISCGTLCAGDEAEYTEGTTVTLTATAKAGSRFDGWTGCDSEPSATQCKITVVEETTIEAEFNEIEKLPLTVEKTGTGTGTVTSVPAGISCGPSCPEETAEYLEGATVTLTASASAGSRFDGWTGCDSEPSATQCKISVLAWETIQAEFNEIETFKLRVEKTGTGAGKVESTSPASPKIVCGSECEKEFQEGLKVTLAAAAAPGSTFAGWSGGGCSGTGACTVVLKAATTVTATFTANPAPPSEGTARAGRTARVSGRRAALKLTCSGGPCKGTLKLTARIKQGGRLRRTTIGSASFSLASGASKTVGVRISAAAKQALVRAGTLKATLSGTGVASSAIRLKLP